MIKENADMSMTIEIVGDTLEEMLQVLTEVRRKIRQGKTEGSDTFCVGSYSFEVVDWAGEVAKSEDDI